MRKQSDTPRHLVALVASPGVPIFELAIAAEVFGIDRRDIAPGWYEFVLVGSEAPHTCVAHGITVPAAGGLEMLRSADTVIVPACADGHADPPSALLDELRAADARGARIVAICSGSFVLAAAGLLDGRRATTHWMHADELARRHPQVTVDASVLYVHDHVWTSAGSAAGLDMCLEIVRTDHGSAVANELARRIVTPPRRDGGQTQYVRPAAGSGTAATTTDEVRAWAHRHLSDATVVAMAARAGVSTRTLNRRFRVTGGTPQAWLQKLRVDTAAELLESTDLTVDTIARRVGLGTAANLRAHFSRSYGVPPAQYRRTFRHGDEHRDLVIQD